MIKSRNIDPNAEFALTPVIMPIVLTAPVNGPVAEAIMPYAGKIITARFRASTTFTDADDSVRVKVQKNSTDIVAAAVDPIAGDTTTTFTLTDTRFAAGDILKGHVLCGSGDVVVGTFAFIIRPLLGGVERAGMAG